jgi:hypothetical protein
VDTAATLPVFTAPGGTELIKKLLSLLNVMGKLMHAGTLCFQIVWAGRYDAAPDFAMVTLVLEINCAIVGSIQFRRAS